MTMDMPTANDDDVASWIARGTAPVFFGFGSMPVESASGTLAMIDEVCAELDVRALICAAGTEFTDVAQSDRIKIIDTVNFTEGFPRLPGSRTPWRCRYDGRWPACRGSHLDSVDRPRSDAVGASGQET